MDAFKKTFFMMIVLMTAVSLIFASGCSQTETTPSSTIAHDLTLPGDLCTSLHGNWLNEWKECEGISASDCAKLGGTFVDCASPCRHDPKATICTMNCVPLCSFGR